VLEARDEYNAPRGVTEVQTLKVYDLMGTASDHFSNAPTFRFEINGTFTQVSYPYSRWLVTRG